MFPIRVYIIITASVLLCFSGCFSDEASSSNNPNISISLSDVTEEHVLNDELNLIGSIGNVKVLDESTWVVMDNSPGVYLFEDHIMMASYGGVGKGPCEYEEISAIEATVENLYVLDASQTKIITYDLDSGECIEEINNENLRGSYYLYKEENSPSFIVANTSYMSMTPDSTNLAHRIFEDESSEPLNLTFGQIDAAKTIISIRSNTLGMQAFDGKLFTYYPLTDSLYSIDLQDYTFESFPLEIDVKKKELENAGQNVNELLEVIRGEFDFVSNLLVTEDWIALMVNLRAARENEEPEMFLQFYSHEGSFIEEVPIRNRVMATLENTLIFTKENSDPNADFTYSVEYRDVIIE
ncbi:MAG TPA: 6-bladed beta-propeller [Gracilimonas sp.]|uniref:6-bladed beta-propeller n=1 Tax=Gracilimonas sp. TaxID=1974203 RepID=UPI002D8A6D29|nr:6-bladed beta-propeller [Gracilimonas sp.]